MDKGNFQKLPKLLERESSACIASENARAAESTTFSQIIEDLNATIKQFNATIGVLQEELRLSKDPKKNSRNSSVPPSKDECRSKRTKARKWIDQAIQPYAYPGIETEENHDGRRLR